MVYGAHQLRVMGANLRFLGGKQKQLDLLRVLDADVNPNHDVIPGLTPLVREAARLAGVNVKRNRGRCPRLAAYVEGRCEVTRPGLHQVVALMEQTGASPRLARPLLDRLTTLTGSDLYWDEVIEVTEVLAADEWVYDLSIDTTHNFVAENVIVHNSNVADAVRWALGENNARVLRAKRNEELIFGGSETRKALSHA